MRCVSWRQWKTNAWNAFVFHFFIRCDATRCMARMRNKSKNCFCFSFSFLLSHPMRWDASTDANEKQPQKLPLFFIFIFIVSFTVMRRAVWSKWETKQKLLLFLIFILLSHPPRWLRWEKSKHKTCCFSLLFSSHSIHRARWSCVCQSNFLYLLLLVFSLCYISIVMWSDVRNLILLFKFNYLFTTHANSHHSLQSVRFREYNLALIAKIVQL